MFASAVALPLIAPGMIGATAWSERPAQAAAVDTSGLQGPAAPSFAAMIERVKPAVVSIRVDKAATAKSEGASNSLQDLSPLGKFLVDRFGDESGNLQLQARPTIGEGAGFFVSSDGYIVTNNHLVEDARSIAVGINDGETVSARVVGADAKTDVAILKIDRQGDYPFVAFATEEPRIGDWVIAIGNPYGLGGSVTAGIVSGTGRSIAADPYDDFIQIDAPINMGNSGGPTFNTQGQVVGLNTAIMSPSRGSVGIAFAIPAGTVAKVVEVLQHGGIIARGRLGVSIQAVTKEIADGLGLDPVRGVIVNRTEAGTAAEKAGLEAGDVITSFDGQPVGGATDMIRRVAGRKPGDSVELTFWRDGADKTVVVTLDADQDGRAPKVSPLSEDRTERLGVDLAPANRVTGAGQTGVAIVAVDPDGAAAGEGLNPGDIILKVSGLPVSRLEDVARAVADARRKGRKAVLFQVRTSTGERFVAFILAGSG